MGLAGKQKAALLLMSLDVATAAELLKGLDTEVVQEMALELAHLDASGYQNSKERVAIARQFVNCLQSGQEFHNKRFLSEMLKLTIGSKAKQIKGQIVDLLRKRDHFKAIRSADSQTIATILEDEHPQAIAVVLSELPAKKSGEVLDFLGEGIRLSAVSRMVSSKSVTVAAKEQIAETVCKRLKVITTGFGASLRAQLEAGALSH